MGASEDVRRCQKMSPLPDFVVITVSQRPPQHLPFTVFNQQTSITNFYTVIDNFIDAIKVTVNADITSLTQNSTHCFTRTHLSRPSLSPSYLSCPPISLALPSLSSSHLSRPRISLALTSFSPSHLPRPHISLALTSLSPSYLCLLYTSPSPRD